jgi:hypothetical protein
LAEGGGKRKREMPILDEIEQFKRELLDRMLAQCTPLQRDLFDKMFVDGVPEDKLLSALGLVERTIAKK